MRLTVHHLSGVRVERLLEHLRSLGTILGARHLHGNVGLLLVVAGDVQAVHVRAGRATLHEAVLLAKRRKLDRRCTSVRRAVRAVV